MSISTRTNSETKEQDRYDITEFAVVSFTYTSHFDIKKFLNKDYNILSKIKEVDETSFDAYPIRLKIIINQNRINELKAKEEVKELKIEKTIGMASVKIIETSNSDFSEGLKEYFKQIPCAIFDGEQYYDVGDTVAHHRGHPCYYKLFIPIASVQRVEAEINSIANLRVIPKCYELKLELNKYQQTEATMASLQDLDKRIRVQSDNEHLKCWIPVEIAMKCCLFILTRDIKIISFDNPKTNEIEALSIKVKKNYAFIKAMITEKNENQAIGLLNNLDINPHDCIIALNENEELHPLFIALNLGMCKLIRLMLEPKYGIDVNKIKWKNNQPFILEVCENCLTEQLMDMIDLLLDAGVKVNTRNNLTQNALDMLIKRLNQTRIFVQEDDLAVYHYVVHRLRNNSIEESVSQTEKLNYLLPNLNERLRLG